MKTSDKLLLVMVLSVIILVLSAYMKIIKIGTTNARPDFKLNHEIKLNSEFINETDSIIIISGKNVNLINGYSSSIFYSFETKPLITRYGKTVHVKGYNNNLNIVLEGKLKYLEIQSDTTRLENFIQDSIKLNFKNDIVLIKKCSFNKMDINSNNSKITFKEIKTEILDLYLYNHSIVNYVKNMELNCLNGYIDKTSYFENFKAKRINMISENRSFHIEIY